MTDPRRHSLHKLLNLLHSAVLVIGMAAIAGGCAWTIWGPEGVLWAVVGIVFALALSPSVPPGLVLSLHRARPIGRHSFPEGHAVLEELSRRAGLPAVPQLFYVPTSFLNAFAVGSPREAAIAVTDGMLRTLTLRELAAVLAHEVSHIAGNDLWIMNLASTLSRVTSLLSYFGMLLLFLNLPLIVAGALAAPWLLVLLLVAAPTLMNLLQLALSRAREYDADLEAARLVGDPEALASALVKLEHRQGRFWEGMLSPRGQVPEPTLLRSHPPTEERVRRLLDLRQPMTPVAVPGTGDRPATIRIPVRVVQPAPRWHRPWY